MRWLLLLVLSQAGPAAAQVALSGTVRDSLTRQPLPFASIFLANTTYGTTTDAQGRYRLAGVPGGSYTLAASYLGYALRQLTAVLHLPSPPGAELEASGVPRQPAAGLSAGY